MITIIERQVRRMGRRTAFVGMCLAASGPAVVASVLSASAAADSYTVTSQIAVDQFGWLPGLAKVAVFAEVVRGQNAGSSYRVGSGFEVRRQADGSVAYRGKLRPWNDGKVSDLAGDRVWYADFSDLRTPGTYYLYDAAHRVGSFPFRIGDDIYGPVLRDSVRTYYYQRSGTPVTQKSRWELASPGRSPWYRSGSSGPIHARG